MNNEDEDIYTYSELFKKNYSSNNEENNSSYEKENNKKKDYINNDTSQNGTNEYSKLRAESSTILNNYFVHENIKCDNDDNVKENLRNGIIIFPLNKKYVLNIFNGLLINNKHTIKLEKIGFYCLYLENNNNSNWDNIFLGMSKMQVDLCYKLSTVSENSNDNDEEFKNNNKNAKPNVNNSNTCDFKDEKNKETIKKKNKKRADYSEINSEIDEIYKYNLDQAEKILNEITTTPSNNMNTNKRSNRNNINDNNFKNNNFNNEKKSDKHVTYSDYYSDMDSNMDSDTPYGKNGEINENSIDDDNDDDQHIKSFNKSFNKNFNKSFHSYNKSFHSYNKSFHSYNKSFHSYNSNNNDKLNDKHNYDAHFIKNKNDYSISYNDENENTETVACTFNTTNQMKVPSNKKKHIYFFNPCKNNTLYITVRTSMALGMSIMCRYGIMYCGKPHLIPRDPENPFSNPVSILSLDGGGILALSSLIVLSRIENEIRKIVGNEEVNITDCFDMICGTSAGGLISLALLKLMSLQNIMKLLPYMINKIFEGKRNLISGIFFEGYDVQNLKDIFMQELGNEFLVNYKHNYCFVTATDVKHNPYKLFLLRNYTHKYNAINGISYEGISKIPIWLAAWATASAPTYLKGPSADDFKNMGFNIMPEIHLVDGALKASNPSLIALEECARLNNKNLPCFIAEDLDTLVSIGTGAYTTKLTQSGINKKSASTLEIIINSAHLLTRANDTHREVLQWLADTENTYFRFNVPSLGDIDIDSKDGRTFDTISKATRDYLYDEKYFEIKRLAQKLANNYIRLRYL
ncbi:phospholipase A2, putative [Hepatocystis sp. ex Piliocolobus tephrosceles]|nr:phospholipase A2, putative [Hepatocystis sp. ex Piliocolobus tephrosceles]